MATDTKEALAPFISPHVAGFLALGLTVFVWAGFFLSLRAGAKANLPVGEIAAFRFLPAAIFFLPVLWRHWRRILAVPRILLLIIVCGAGMPYFLVAGTGMRLASVADGSTLLPGTLPIFVSVLAFFIFGQKITSMRRNGLVLDFRRRFADVALFTEPCGSEFVAWLCTVSFREPALGGLHSRLAAQRTRGS
jgi:hypothetical protein